MHRSTLILRKNMLSDIIVGIANLSHPSTNLENFHLNSLNTP